MSTAGTVETQSNKLATFTSVAEARQYLTEQLDMIQHLSHLMSLGHWDLEVNMPEKAAGPRGNALAAIGKLQHGYWVDPNMLRALDRMEKEGTLTETDKVWIREVRRDVEQSVKLPSEFVETLSKTESEAQGIWINARKEKNFKAFEPILKRLVELNQKRAEYLGYQTSPYNALLDLYEPGLTVETLEPLFSNLVTELSALVKQYAGQPQPPAEFLTRSFPVEQQMAFSKKLLNWMHFDLERGRLDCSVHPFTCDIGGPMDVRLTTRHTETLPMECLLAVMHEGGHGIYEQGHSETLPWPLNTAVSLGIHESQSRLWENQVGRSLAFWRYAFDPLKAEFPHALKGVSVEQFYRAINRCEPSFIRIEADELTYNLHIVLRYHIERQLIEGKLNVSEIPDLWNATLQEYLGITPPDDAQGCLQDVHWAHGSFGYFPTYTLGNLYSAQFFHAALKEIPKLSETMNPEVLGELKVWLNNNIHQYGRSKTAAQLCQDVTGEALNAQHFVAYCQQKFDSVFNV